MVGVSKPSKKRGTRKLKVDILKKKKKLIYGLKTYCVSDD